MSEAVPKNTGISIRVGGFTFGAEAAELFQRCSQGWSEQNSLDSSHFLFYLANGATDRLQAMALASPALARDLNDGVDGGDATGLSACLGEMCMQLGQVDGVRWLYSRGGDAAGLGRAPAYPPPKDNLGIALGTGSERLWSLLLEKHGKAVFRLAGITKIPGRPRVFDLLESDIGHGRSPAPLLAHWLALDPSLLDVREDERCQVSGEAGGVSLLQRAEMIPQGMDRVHVIRSAQAKRQATRVLEEINSLKAWRVSNSPPGG